MYPLDMIYAAAGGYAVANTEDEHQSLSDAGYEPKFVGVDASESDDQGHTVDSVRATLDAAGIVYKKSFGLARLIALLP